MRKLIRRAAAGQTSYRSLQFTLTRRLSSGLTLNSQYSLARSFGITSGSNESRTAAQPTGASPKAGSNDTNNYAADLGYNSFTSGTRSIGVRYMICRSAQAARTA